jgi:hypothetical protein
MEENIRKTLKFYEGVSRPKKDVIKPKMDIQKSRQQPRQQPKKHVFDDA